MTRGSWTATIALLIFTMGTSIITPLLPLYQREFALTDGQITLLFATYSATVAASMLLLGNVSDRHGRKAVMLPAMACITLASLILGFADSVPLLFLGRLLQGLAIGGFLGVGTALIVDHAHAHRRAWASMVAGLAFRLGFGLGPGLAGVVAERSADPIHRPFQGHLLLMLFAFAAILVTPETVSRLPRAVRAAAPPRRRIQVGVPAGQFRAFALFLAPAAFLLGFLDATLLSVVPLYMVRELGVTNLAVVGLVGFLVLGSSGFTPLVARRIPPRTAVLIGTSAGASASLLVVAAAGLDAAWAVVVAAAAIGLLNGLTLQGGTAICGVSVPIAERGKLMSALYMCAYSGTLPTIGLGYLSQAIGITPALGVFCAVAVAVAVFIVVVGGRAFREVVPYVEPTPAVVPPAA